MRKPEKGNPKSHTSTTQFRPPAKNGPGKIQPLNLRELNTHLWDNHDERIPLPEYKKLVAWIKEKERQKEPECNVEQTTTRKGPARKEKDSIRISRAKVQQEQLLRKVDRTRQQAERTKGTERLPIDQYQKLRGWIENADRTRWAGVTERQLQISKATIRTGRRRQDITERQPLCRIPCNSR